MISAPGDPPGSRVSFVWMPNDFSRSARIDAWVDFPVPSPPSKVMKRPRISQPLLACFWPFRTTRSVPRGTCDLYPFGGRAKQVDHKFRGGIEGALRDRACGDAFGCLDRYFQHLGVAAPDLQLADGLPFAHRRPDRSSVNQLGGDLVADTARHHQPDRALCGNGNAAPRAAKDLGLG